MRSVSARVLAILLVGMLLGAFLAAEVHRVFPDHDRELCQLCIWNQLYGWLLAGFALLVFLIAQNLAVESEVRGLSFFPRFYRSRSPPFSTTAG